MTNPTLAHGLGARDEFSELYPPDRLAALRAKLESGEIPGEDEFQSVAMLQAMDVVAMGDTCAREHLYLERQLLMIDEMLDIEIKKDILERAGIATT